MKYELAGIDLVEDVVFVIVSQRNSFHSNRASEKRDLWSTQLRILTGVCILCQFFDILTSRILCFQNESISPRILLSHELELEGAAWTIAPLIPLYVYTDRQIPLKLIILCSLPIVHSVPL